MRRQAKATIIIGALIRKKVAILVAKIEQAVSAVDKIAIHPNRNNLNPLQPTLRRVTTSLIPLPPNRMRVTLEEVVKTVVGTRTTTITIESVSRVVVTTDLTAVDRITITRGVVVSRTRTMVVARRIIIQITTIEAKDPMVLKILEVVHIITIQITQQVASSTGTTAAMVVVCLLSMAIQLVTMLPMATTTWIPTVAAPLALTRRLNASTSAVVQMMTTQKASQPLAEIKITLAAAACP